MPQSALLGGIFIGVLSALPVINVANYCCCLWVVGGGVLTAYLETQRDAHSLPVARGAFLGLIAGIVGALVWLLASLALTPILAPFQQTMSEALTRGAANADPRMRAWFEQVSALAASPVRYVFGFVLQSLIGVAFGSAGGALGAVIFRRSTSVVPPPLPPQP